MGEQVMHEQVKEVRQRLLNLAIHVEKNFEFILDFEKDFKDKSYKVYKGFSLDITIPTVLVGSYRRLNPKKSGETPMKVLQRLQVTIRLFDDKEYAYQLNKNRYIVKAGLSGWHCDWKNEMTEAEYEMWLYKVEQLVKNHPNTDNKYFSQVERKLKN
jgi:hypothetical protein